VMNADTRAAIKAKGVSVWLKAEIDVLLRRVAKRKNERPMLQSDDLSETLRQLLSAREPAYAQADLTVQSHEGPHDAIVAEIMRALSGFLGEHSGSGA
jgi:shikimate kinase